jgi:DNA (cytosine-5)-methyltransferase 1
MTLTHGSLFSGVGGFDLGADAAGIETLWQAEIDKKASSVLARHWPNATRYGDVKEVKGDQVKPVDIISFGSPCQDLSIAGKGAGLQGSRSGLFFEAIRIIKEMRDATQNQYPQIAIWENVRGALSSNEGKDFHAAIQALAKLGAVDISYRLVNACHFGVPQRRVFVVADFGGERAGQILAKPTRLLWHPPQIREEGKEVTREVEGSTNDNSSRTYKRVASCLSTSNQRIDYETETFVLETQDAGTSNDATPTEVKSLTPWPEMGEAMRVYGTDGVGPIIKTHQINILEASSQASEVERVSTLALTEREGKPGGGKGLPLTKEMSPTLRAGGTQNIAEPIAFSHVNSMDIQPSQTVWPTLRVGSAGNAVSEATDSTNYRVRRLTPVECERLMGWPDKHTKYDKDDNELSDSARYKMCGNGIVAPVAQWLCENIVQELT